MPKFHLLYFKHLLDIAIINFFDTYNDCFKNIDGKYVLSKNISKTKLLSIFRKLIITELSKFIVPYNRLQPNYFFILGSCLPNDNILLNFKNEKYFPEKLNKLLNNEHTLKYVLKEKDIDINILQFNDMCIELFNTFFNSNILIKYLGKEYKNIFFIQHKNIDSYILFKIIKHIYGKNNCINIYKEKMNNIKTPLTEINDIIEKYINKTDVNKSQQLKIISEEIEQYIQERLKTL